MKWKRFEEENLFSFKRKKKRERKKRENVKSNS